MDDLVDIVAHDVAAEAGADTFGSIDEDHGDDGRVVDGFDTESIIIEVGECVGVFGHEDVACDGVKLCEDVSFGCGVMSTL